MSHPSSGRILTKLRGQEGFGLVEGLIAGVAGGLLILGMMKWAVSQTKQEAPPPKLYVSAPAPLPPPPTNLDEACVRNAYETQGLIFDAAGNPAKFEAPQGAMWFIPGIVSGSGSVYTAREVEARVKHRYYLAELKWKKDCQPRAPEELPTQAPPPVDVRDLYYGTYALTWGPGTGTCVPTANLPTTLTASSPGTSISGITIQLGAGSPARAQLGADRFSLTAFVGEQADELSGTFVESGGRVRIEGGQYIHYLRDTLECTIPYTGTKQ